MFIWQASYSQLHSNINPCTCTCPKWPTPLPPLLSLCYVVAMATVRRMLFCVLHIFITDPCSSHYWLHSGPGWAEWPAGRQTYTAISQTWQHAGRHICRKHGRVKRRISHAQTQVAESDVITHWVCPSVIHWGATVRASIWQHLYFRTTIKGNWGYTTHTVHY